MSFVGVGYVYPLYGFVNEDDTACAVYVGPFQGAHFAYTQAGAEADVDAQVHE